MADPGHTFQSIRPFRGAGQPTGLRRMLESVMDAGRGLLARDRPRPRPKHDGSEGLVLLSRELLDHRGEAAGLALANDILHEYHALSVTDRLAFLTSLSEQFGPDADSVKRAAEAYSAQPALEPLLALASAIESPRRELFRRLNMVPDGTSSLVAMRGHLLEALDEQPELRAAESDLRHLLTAWFNRGFLVMERIDWTTAANVLERIIAYEAVHEIKGWDDLRLRLAADRRCFAFFHPAMPDDPLIFVEVALSQGSPRTIDAMIGRDREVEDVRDADTAVFYSISNCHEGLRGISFGHFLIKQVIDELRRELEQIAYFVTLSPVPGFRRWLGRAPPETLPPFWQAELGWAGELLGRPEPVEPLRLPEEDRHRLMRLMAYYLLSAKRNGEPEDPVARFHLANGAVLERINWGADLSTAGIERSAGMMVNYAYVLADIEKNHELYFDQGEVLAAAAVRRLAGTRSKRVAAARSARRTVAGSRQHPPTADTDEAS